MTKQGWRYLARVILFLLIFVPPKVWAECNKTLRIAWMGTWKPFNLGSPAEPHGLDLEILQAIMTHAGCKLIYTKDYIPWARHIKMIQVGETDLITGAGSSPERESFAYLIGPYRSELVGIYMLKSSISKYQLKKPADLLTTNFRLGSIIGYNYGVALNQVIEALGRQAQPIPERENQPTNLINYKKLRAGRIDGFLGHPVVETFDLESTNATHDIVRHPMPLIKTGDIYILLSKKANSKSMAIKLQNSLDSIKENGKYQEILDRYSEQYNIPSW